MTKAAFSLKQSACHRGPSWGEFFWTSMEATLTGEFLESTSFPDVSNTTLCFHCICPGRTVDRCGLMPEVVSNPSCTLEVISMRVGIHTCERVEQKDRRSQCPTILVGSCFFPACLWISYYVRQTTLTCLDTCLCIHLWPMMG